MNHDSLVLRIAGRPVGRYITRPEIPARLSPRPYLHPVITLAGTAVTELGPADHLHHLGVGVAVPDVEGHNLWGGRTFVQGQGPTELDNHGTQRHTAFQLRDPDGFVEELRWVAAGSELLRERRTVAATELTETAWALDFTKMVAHWDSGTIGMLNHDLGFYQDHVKALGTDEFRGIPQPIGPGGKRVQVSNPVDGLGVFKSSENKEAAWKFIEFALSKAENSKYNEAAGQVPANNDAAGNAWVSEAEPTKLAAQALTDGSTTIVQLPYYLPDWNTLSKADNEPAFQKVLNGSMSAEDFLNSMADQLNKAQKEWNEQKG
ncbi:extracellular solute-binding protein [Streptomyces cavernae]|uniref:extracellular solute-binding protein n=1 Tax=Streptomyces cavernae TaxID=2259034 RepID=UPI000FEBECDB|nr:extracellular solute-binding protein [Streptomyces cavernae]